MPSTVLVAKDNLKKLSLEPAKHKYNITAERAKYYDRIKHRVLRLHNRGESNTL